jgi:hypothetical protein
VNGAARENLVGIRGSDARHLLRPPFHEVGERFDRAPMLLVIPVSSGDVSADGERCLHLVEFLADLGMEPGDPEHPAAIVLRRGRANAGRRSAEREGVLVPATLCVTLTHEVLTRI